MNAALKFHPLAEYEHLMNIERVLVQAISVSLGHRKVDPAIVDSLAESMKRLGMLSPIIVRVITEDNIHLIAGRHRLEAAKRLGWGMIEAHCFTGDDTEARERSIRARDGRACFQAHRARPRYRARHL